MFNEMDQAFREEERLRHEKELQYYNMSREKLRKAVETRIRTTFIGSLDSIEKYLGTLWNHGQDDMSKLTDSQKFYRKLWNHLRNDILDKGNLQLKSATSEMDEYTIRWNKKKYTFIFKEPEQ